MITCQTDRILYVVSLIQDIEIPTWFFSNTRNPSAVDVT